MELYSMKYLISGLGNPGAEYANTRHNIGFLVLDRWMNKEKVSFSSEKLCMMASHRFRGRPITVIKPSTYVNLSGKAIKYWLDKKKITPQNLIVIVDDIALPFEKIRIKTAGSSGGHNGLKSIESCLLSQEYVRIKVGIGNHFPKGQQAHYVLSPFDAAEWKSLDTVLDTCIEAIECILAEGVTQAMNQFNNSKV